MARRVIQPSTVGAFWDQVRRVGNPFDAAVAVGVSGSAGWKWFTDAGGVKPRVSKPKRGGPRPRLTVGERVEIQVGVGRNESLRSIGRRLGRPASTIKRELDNNGENRYNGRKSGYRRKEAFGARQSGRSCTVRYDALAAQRGAA